MSQKKAILNYLEGGNSLTPIDALNKFGCFRLGARICELRREGYHIENVGKDYGEYRIVKERQLEFI